MLEILQSYDASLLNSLRNSIDPNSAFQISAIRVFSDIEVLFVAVSLIGLWMSSAFLTKTEKGKRDALALFYCVMFAFAIYWALNWNLPVRPRPESVSAIPPLIDHLPDNSFPSGHGIFAGASFAAALLLRRRALAYAFLTLGIPMLLARVLAGIHYPGDVTAGFLLGSFLSYAGFRFLSREAVKKSVFFSLPIKIASYFRL